MQHLITYIEENVEGLVDAALPGLLEVDGVFAECEFHALRGALVDVMWQYVAYAHDHDPRHIDVSYTALTNLWRVDGLYLSAVIRAIFALEDIVIYQGMAFYQVATTYSDACRGLRLVTREVLCGISDRTQRRAQSWQPVSAAPAPIQAPGADLGTRITQARAPSRSEELRMLWGRMRAVLAAGSPHQIVAIKGAPGYGKSTLVDAFVERAQQHFGRAPTVLRLTTPRLFSVPDWLFSELTRAAFDVAPGAPGGAQSIAAGLAALLEGNEGLRSEVVQSLGAAAPWLQRLVGSLEEAVDDGLSSSARGARIQQAVAGVVEAIARRARLRAGAPLLLVLEDAGDLDSVSWERLSWLLQAVHGAEPFMLLLTCDVRFHVPREIARLPGYGEITLNQMDMNDGEQLIDGILSPNGLDDQTRLRLNVGARGSPLLLHEAIRQLVEDGVLGLSGERWVEVQALPEGMIGDLAAIVASRRSRLDSSSQEVLELIAVVEDSCSGTVLEEVAGRRAIGLEELVSSLELLSVQGLIERDVQPHDITARARHALIRDEIYRGMSQERRQAIHEDAGEVLSRLDGTRQQPWLAASHLALAGLPQRALHALLEGIDRCLRVRALSTALELANQSGELLGRLPADTVDAFRFKIAWRRERILCFLGQGAERGEALKVLEELMHLGSKDEQQLISVRMAARALTLGDTDAAEEGYLPVMSASKPGSAPWLQAQLGLALSCWQRGDGGEARIFLDEALGQVEQAPPALKARLGHARAIFAAGDGNLKEALNYAFGAWVTLRESGDPRGEALVVQTVGGIFWTMGRLLDAIRLLRRADQLLARDSAGAARARILLQMGQLHAQIGDFEQASRCFGRVLRLVDRATDHLARASAVIGQGRILVNRGQFDEAMTLLAQCLKDLGRAEAKTETYVEALLALAMNFALFARGEKLVVGGLRYAGEAAERAVEIGFHSGLTRALLIQVRGLVVLDRAPEAELRMAEADQALERAMASEPRNARLKAELELARHQVLKALGDQSGADAALRAAWFEVRSQLGCLRGSGYERAFLTNIFHHREIVTGVGHMDPAERV